MITERQEKILKALIKEYLSRIEPISSKLLKEKIDLNISPATIRNELQELTKGGYISQPHISAGRIPTEKAYRYFIKEVFKEKEEVLISSIFKEIKETEFEIKRELKTINKLSKILTRIHKILEDYISNYLRGDLYKEEDFCNTLIKIFYSKPKWKKNMGLIKKIIKELEGF